MSKLTFKEFMKLSRKEKNIRYKELSDYDQFLARMSDVGYDGKGVSKEPLSKETKIQIARESGIKVIEDESANK